MSVSKAVDTIEYRRLQSSPYVLRVSFDSPAASRGRLVALLECVELSATMLKSTDLDLRANAMLCLANLASNKATHRDLGRLHIAELTNNLNCSDRLVQL